MKRLILLYGANGVGKSTAAAALLERLPQSAYVDSDYCRMTNPDTFSDAMIRLNYLNMSAMIRNAFDCPEIQNVIVPYGFHGHRRRLFEDILAGLRRDGAAFHLVPILLACGEEENVRRARADGRDTQRIERGLWNSRPLYEAAGGLRIDVTRLSVEETVEEILAILGGTERR